MKKSQIFFAVCMFLFGIQIHAQYKYKLEYDIEVFFSSAGPTQTFALHLANSRGDTSGPRLFNATVQDGHLETYNVYRDEIVTSSSVYTGINKSTSQSGSTWHQYYDFCDIPNNHTWLMGDRGIVGFFHIARIESFATINGYNSSNTTLSECTSTTLKAFSNACGNIRYAVQYQIGSSTTWSTLLAYGSRGGSFSFQKSDFPGLSTNQNVRLRIQYNNTGTIEYSDVLTYSFIPCPPELTNTQTANTMCSDTDDGGVTLTFNRSLNTGEQFRATLRGVTPEGFTIPEADATANSFAAGNTYIWPNNLQAGNYTITYQTFLLNGPGPEDDQPTSTGETGTFTINRPSEVTVAISSTVQPKCTGDTGTVTLSASGGSGSTYQFSNNNGPWQSSPIFTGLAQGSVNSFRSRLVLGGGNYCISPSHVNSTINTITNGITITSAGVNVPPSYPGATDGEIVINTSGGTANYTYTVSGPVTRSVTLTSNLGVLDALPAGTYTISVSDANSCMATHGDVVLNPIPIPALGTPQITAYISCNGQSDGVINIPISGGVTNYNYRWYRDGNLLQSGTTGTSFSRSGLVAGEYTLTVSSNGAPIDVPQATASTSVSLTQPSVLTITSATANDISCFGGTDGSIDVQVSGGTSPYRYRLAHTGSFTTVSGNTFSIPIVSPGSYPLYIQDANNCTIQYSTNLTISQPSAPIQIAEVLSSHKDNEINGGSEGVLEISISNNNGTQSVSWTRNGSTFTPPTGSTNTRLVGLSAGRYNLMFTDNSGCTATLATAIEITEPGPLGIISLDGSTIACFGEATGTIDATVTGTPPFTYSWERQGDSSFTAPNSPNLTGLRAGTYTLRLTDATPTPEISATVTITQPLTALGATENFTGVSCNGSTDGSVSINATGGTPPYSYAIDSGNYQTSNEFSGLAPGNYTVRVRDANNCTFEVAGTIVEPSPISVSTDELKNASSSGGTDGSISVTISGGTPSYGITWSGPGNFTSNNEDIGGLAAGQYTLQIRDAAHSTDASGCYFIKSFTISEPGPLTIDGFEVTNVSCKGEATGAITSLVTGNDPIQYTWEYGGNVISGATTNILQNIVAGEYTLTVDDSTSNPPVTQTVTVLEPTLALTANGLPIDISCHGGTNGALQINAQGGTTPYEYSLDGTTFQSNNRFTNLSEAYYTATVRDANHCIFTLPTPIFVNAPQEMGLILDENRPLTAANSMDGAIHITPFGGTPPYTFTWTSDNGFASAQEDITALAGGTYTVVIKDNNYSTGADTGCTYTESFVVSEPAELTVTISQIVDLECHGDDFAELQATALGGVSITPYIYQWYQRVGSNDMALSETTDSIGELSAGDYFVRVTDNNGITADSQILTVSQPDELQITVESITHVLCANDNTGAIDIMVMGGTPPYRYYWDNGSAVEDLMDLVAGTYNIEVVDSRGCFTDMDITISEPSDPLTILDATITDASEYLASDGTIALEIVGGALPVTISWMGPDGSYMGDTASLAGLQAGIYTVTLTDANDCTVMETYNVGQPDIVEAQVTHPICYGDANGSIALTVNQGNGFYTYTWNNGATTSELEGLEAGTYTVSIDGLPNGQLVRTYEIVDPLPFEVNLGDDRVLCAGQVLHLDGTVDDTTAVYQWRSDNGFTSSEPMVSLSESGQYTLTVSVASGCIAMDTILLNATRDEIDAEFAVSSQGFTGESILAVDISYPLPDSVTWIFPEEAQVLVENNDELEVVFDQAGEYELTLVTTKGECIAERTKTVLIVDRDATVIGEGKRNQTPSIDEFLVYPNPTSGKFKAQVKIPERGTISLKVFSFANNALVASDELRGEDTYNVDFDISNMPSGVYVVMLETPFGSTLRKLVLK